MPDGIARLWFVPGEGIDRAVITSEIQRFLGNDATVRPGLGTDGEFEGVEGYWIKAFRNLTSFQIEDLRLASAKWRSEQQQRRQGPGTSYVGSNTYHHHGRMAGRGGESPVAADAGYGGPSRRDHTRTDPRMADQRMPLPPVRGDEMDLDYPPAPSARRYEDNRGFPGDRPPYQDGRPPYADPAGYRGQPGPYPYGGDSRDPRDMRDPRDIRDPRDMRDPRDIRDPRDMRDMRDPRIDPRADPRADPRYDSRGPSQYPVGTAGPNYPRPQDAAGYYPPTTGPYGGPQMNAQMQPPFGTNGYGAPSGQLPRESGREPRYAGPPGYANDPRTDLRSAEGRYAYPSPPVTVVDTRDASPNTMPPSSYPSAPGQGPVTSRYDYDGRPPPSSSGAGFPSGPPPSGFGTSTLSGPSRGSTSGQRPLVTSDLGPEARRRRMN